MRRIGVLLVSLIVLLGGCSGTASSPAPSRSPSPSPSLAAWPIIGHWRAAALTRSKPGLVVTEAVSTRRSSVVVLGRDGAVRATLWRSPDRIVHFDCDPAAGEIVATLLGPYEATGYRYQIVLLSADGTVRRVTDGMALGWEALPSPLLLRDGSVLWQRMRLVAERELYSPWYAERNGTPQPVHIVGHLPRGFALSSLLPLAGRRTVALVDVRRTGAVALAHWSAGRLAVADRPYVRKFAFWILDDPPGGALPSTDALVVQGYAPGEQVRVVRWVDGKPTSALVLSKLPPEPRGGDATPFVLPGPAGYVLLYGWWPGQAAVNQGTDASDASVTDAPVRLLLVNLRTGAVTRSRFVLPPSVTGSWQWLP